jgi:signal transduction histidine kinase
MFSGCGMIVRVWLVLIGLVLAATGAAAEEHKRVMILHSVGREFRPWNEYAKHMRAELDRQSPWPLDVQEHSLVAARTADPNPDKPFVDYLRTLYGDQPPDLIIVVGAPAANFIQRHRKDLFATAPMLFTTVEQRRVRTSDLTGYDTVVAVIHDFRFLFESFLRIAPETRTIAIINGDSPNEQFWQGEMRRELKPLEGRIEIRWYDKLSYEDLLKQTAALPPHSAIFWYQMIVDGAGVAHEGDRALTRLFQTANAPIFSHDDAFYGGETGETVGGPMHSALAGAMRAAGVAIRILGGEKPGDIKTPASRFAAPRYDWRELQRWKIDERLLPQGAPIDFRVPTAWETYRWQIMFVCALILIQAGLISGLLFERRRRVDAEVEARQRSAELAHINRFAMAGELTATIAHEINQPLGAILANIETAELMVKSSSPDLQEIGEILADVRRDDVRASEVIGRLRSLLKKAPFELKDVDLNDVARETVQFLTALATARQVDLVSLIAPESLPVRGDSIQLQQVILNLIVNAMDAMSGMPVAERRIKVTTARDGHSASLSVSDSGPGIPIDQIKRLFEPFFTTKPQGMGMGLSIARTIVEAHGGQLSAENLAGRGAAFRITLPLNASPD